MLASVLLTNLRPTDVHSSPQSTTISHDRMRNYHLAGKVDLPRPTRCVRTHFLVESIDLCHILVFQGEVQQFEVLK